MFFLFNFVYQPFYLGLMKIFKLVFVLSMLSDKIVFHIFILSFNQIDFM